MSKSDRHCMTGLTSSQEVRRTFCSMEFRALAMAGSMLCAGQTAWSQASEQPPATELAAASAPLVPLQVQPTAAGARPVSPTTLPAPLLWKELNQAQKLALGPLERDWDSLDASRRRKWLDVAGRLPKLQADEQARMQERMRDWAGLTPAERQQARIGFQVTQQVKSDEREAKWAAYQALPAEKRQELTDKAASKLSVKAPAAPNAPTDGASQLKSNLVPAAPKGPLVKQVAPSVLQAKQGASTMLITQVSSQPTHLQAGQTKVFADPALVDSKTLLPKQTKTEPSLAKQ